MSLKTAYTIINDIKHTQGDKNKQAKLQIGLHNCNCLEKVLLFALNPYLRFNMTNIEFIPNAPASSVTNIFSILVQLSKQKGATNEDRTLLSTASSIDEETVKAVNMILKKNIDCGLGAKSVRKEIPEIPEHEPMLCGLKCTNFDQDHLFKFIEANGGWSKVCWSIKKNGVRANIFVKKDQVTWLSRSGKEYYNFHKFDESLLNMVKYLRKMQLDLPETIEFDGEVTPKNKSFNNLMTQVRKLEGIDPELFQLELFDLPSINGPLLDRLDYLHSVINHENPDDISYVDHIFGELTSITSLMNLLDEVDDKGEEGLVLKGVDSPIKRGKNHKYWIKVKKFREADVEVLEAIRGDGKYTASGQKKEVIDNLRRLRSTKNQDSIIKIKSYLTAKAFNEDPDLHTWIETLEFYEQENYHEHIKPSLGKLLVDFEGMPVEVGGGFTDIERAVFLYNLPKIIEVHYKEPTEDGSMLFPEFKRIREDKEEL